MEVIDPESSGLTNEVCGRLSFFTKGDDPGPKNEECASALATPSKVHPATTMHVFCHVSMQIEYAYEYGVCMRIRTHSLTGLIMQSRAWGCCAYVGNAGVHSKAYMMYVCRGHHLTAHVFCYRSNRTMTLLRLTPTWRVLL